MKVVFRAFYGPSDWGWVNQQVAILRVEDTCGIMAVDDEADETVGACIMDNWTKNSVQCHFMVSSPMVLRHGFLEECFDFLFNECGMQYIYGLVPGDNEKALRLNAHMGFTERVRLKDAFADGVDYVLMELKRENCRYVPVVEVA